jgi:hypothetical protein
MWAAQRTGWLPEPNRGRDEDLTGTGRVGGLAVAVPVVFLVQQVVCCELIRSGPRPTETAASTTV